MMEPIKGRDVLVALAERFPQLYVAPAEGADAANMEARRYGEAPEDANLDHFVSTPDDELREVETPAGTVEVVFLANRTDFETFLQIMGHASRPDPIARTVGAITYRGLADWGKVKAAHEACIASGGDWSTEFARLARTPGAFRAEIVAISEGPYSNIAADLTPYGEDEWREISREIRLYHECAHVVCRRTMPEDILPIWDEITADVNGLLCAIGRYDVTLAALFLGVTPQGFAGGRLDEYLDDEQKTRIDEISREVYAALVKVQELTVERDVPQSLKPFDFLLELKRDPIVNY